jgi:hypothetical protein
VPGHARHRQPAAPGGPVLVPAEDSDTLVLVSLPDGGPRPGQRAAVRRQRATGELQVIDP